MLPTRPSPVGISWFLGEYRGNAMAGHSGGDTGYTTDLAMLPEKKIAVVWMTNSDWPGIGVRDPRGPGRGARPRASTDSDRNPTSRH